VGSRTNTEQSIKGYGYARFQLDSGGFLGIEHRLYVVDLKVNLLSVSSFEDDGYALTFQNGRVLVYSREATLDTTIMIDIYKERLYMSLGRLIVWCNGYLDSTLDSTSKSMSDSTSASKALSEVESCEIPPNTLGRMSP